MAICPNCNKPGFNVTSPTKAGAKRKYCRNCGYRQTEGGRPPGRVPADGVRAKTNTERTRAYSARHKAALNTPIQVDIAAVRDGLIQDFGGSMP
jgi:hypothetical protein